MADAKYEHIMVDLETLDTAPTAAVISIGAVPFSYARGVATGLKFYVNVDPDIWVERRLMTRSDATLQWWAAQSDEAKAQLRDPAPVDVAEALMAFDAWVNEVAGPLDVKVWAHGSSFDVPILENAYRAVGAESPWKFWDVRDTRTLFAVTGFDYYRRPRTSGPAHAADADAVHQAEAVVEALRAVAAMR